MPDPWEKYQTATDSPPWEKYSQTAGPGRGGRKPTQEQVDSSRAAQHTRDLRYGIPTLATGIGELSSPGYRKKGIHDTLTGAGELAVPAVIPALAAATVATIGAGVGGYLGSKVARGGAKLFNASDENADLAGDVGGAVGALEGGTGFRASKSLASAIKTPEWVSRIRGQWKSLGPTKLVKTAGPTAPRPGTDTSYRPISTGRAPTEDELAFEAAPKTFRKSPPTTGNPPEAKAISTADKLPRWHMIRDRVKGKTPDASGIPGELQSGRKVPAPGSRVTVDAPKVDESAKSAAELMKAVGIGPDEILKATPEQWKMIEQHVGSTFDRQAAIKELQAISKEVAKPSPKGTLPTPKTPKPTPGGAKVESTVTPEARAARAEEHATKLAATIRKTLAADKIPEPGNDAAWKVLEDQTGTEATPSVRKSAIDKARKLWSEGPRSAGELQRRRAEYFQNNPKQ